jgi:signal transduction histidine kinase
VPTSAHSEERAGLESDYISIASHELRSPIAVVHGIAATLDAHIDDLTHEQVHALLGTLLEQTDRLRDLADQLLDLSRIESGAATGRPERIRPRARLDELLPRIAGEHADDVHVDVDHDCVIVADPLALERVAANLILNALRYGAPPVEVRIERDGGTRLVVEDRGEGVPPEFVPHLFERFSRGDNTRRGSLPGTGLGLSIARAYAAAMGAKLSYQPARPRGARFTLSLPGARS